MTDLFLAAALLLLFAAGIVWFEVRASREDRKTSALRSTNKDKGGRR